MISIRALIGCCFLLVIGVLSLHADTEAPAVLHFSDGDFLSGKFVDSESPDTLRWQSTIATNPFDVRMENVSAVHFPAPSEQELPDADYCFELSGGDRLFGDLKSISADLIEIETPPLGLLHVDRNHIVRITRQRGSAREWVFLGPHGLAGWEQFPDENPWREEAGHLITDVAGATIRNECKIPEKACIEFEISWKKKPDFILMIGEGPKQEEKPKPVGGRGAVRVLAPVEIRTRSAPVTTEYRFEVWEKSLVIVSERRAIADAAYVTDLPAGEGRIHMRSYLDRQSGRLSVYTHDGKRLAQIEVPDPEEAVGIEVRNKRGDIRLEHLAVSAWDGKLPTEVATDKPNLQKLDGSVVYGNVTGFDAESNQFLVAGEQGETRVNAPQMTTLLVTPEAATYSAPLRVALNTGASIMGRLAAVRDDKLSLQRDGIEEPLVFPISAVRSLLGSTPQSSAGNNSTTAARDQGHAKNEEGDFDRVGRLEADGVRSHGWLVDGASDGGGSCLVWQPRQSTTSSPLVSGLSGQLVYRDPPPPRPQPTNTRTTRPARPAARPGVWGGVLDAFGVPKNLTAKPIPKAVSKKSLLHLRAGDNVPCEVTGVDEEGVYIKSTAVDATFIPHAQVKAIELSTDAKLPDLDEKKRERLLTLPRMLRNNPPTHLLIATNGDVLRGRLQEMNEQHVAVEIHLETRDLQREYVASIIWLHGGELEVSKDEPKVDEDAELLVQAVRPDGIRLTFTPHSVIDNALVGESKTLGACRVDLQTVDVLLLGDRIQEAADELEYHSWKLVHAPDPQYLQEEESGGPGPAVSSSGLIGNEAPEFRLELLNGKQFRLSEQKGHVVVLDFWASWCGPCMQAMPSVDEVVREFDAQGVQLVTVNMQEDKETVKAALERLKLDSTVALDIDGATAEKYEVTAIPQTVIIDAEGKVSHLFVGGGSQLPEQLRDALEELTNEEAKPE